MRRFLLSYGALVALAMLSCSALCSPNSESRLRFESAPLAATKGKRKAGSFPRPPRRLVAAPAAASTRAPRARSAEGARARRERVSWRKVGKTRWISGGKGGIRGGPLTFSRRVVGTRLEQTAELDENAGQNFRNPHQSN